MRLPKKLRGFTLRSALLPQSDIKVRGFTLKRELISDKLGFTLIELLVVISIIAILMAVATVSYSQVQKRARNQDRQTDLALMATALQRYYQDHGFYPSTTVSGAANWEKAGQATTDHFACLLGSSVNNGTFVKSGRDQDCGFVKPPAPVNPASTNNTPANVYIGNGSLQNIPKDPSAPTGSEGYAYISDGQTYALATIYYEGSAPAAKRLVTGSKFFGNTAPGVWTNELKSCASGAGVSCNYVVYSPN